MTFVCSMMLGVFAEKILLSAQTEKKKTAQFPLLGISCVITGKIWGMWFPIIHHIWTSSLVLFTGGWSLLLMTFFYLVIDVWVYKNGPSHW